jgi:hypothetical protein
VLILELICANETIVGRKDQTINASAWANPTAFYTFDGLDTDSYQRL